MKTAEVHGSYGLTINRKMLADHTNYTHWVEITSGKGHAYKVINDTHRVPEIQLISLVRSCVAIVAALVGERSLHAICDTYLW